MTDPFVEVYICQNLGSINTKDSVLNSNSGKKENIGRMLLMHANNREEIKTANAGDIVALVGLKDVTTGEILCASDNPTVLENGFSWLALRSPLNPKQKLIMKKWVKLLGRLAQEIQALESLLITKVAKL